MSFLGFSDGRNRDEMIKSMKRFNDYMDLSFDCRKELSFIEYCVCQDNLESRRSAQNSNSLKKNKPSIYGSFMRQFTTKGTKTSINCESCKICMFS
jgi:hypothetical protein